LARSFRADCYPVLHPAVRFASQQAGASRRNQRHQAWNAHSFLASAGVSENGKEKLQWLGDFVAVERSAVGQSGQITGLLKAWSGGDAAALERLTPLVYAELRRLARRSMRREPSGNTLQTTALVHEAYLRLVDAAGVDWQDRAHFFAVSAQMMRRILVDAARARASAKRGGGVRHMDHSTPVNLDNIPDLGAQRGAELIALDDALNVLTQMNPRHARVVELRFFGGLSAEEIAKVLSISPQSVMRDWKLAKAWLKRELSV
jgi:RNA polymerase sigma factor (TIGR02999 family)